MELWEQLADNNIYISFISVCGADGFQINEYAFRRKEYPGSECIYILFHKKIVSHLSLDNKFANGYLKFLGPA